MEDDNDESSGAYRGYCRHNCGGDTADSRRVDLADSRYAMVNRRCEGTEEEELKCVAGDERYCAILERCFGNKGDA